MQTENHNLDSELAGADDVATRDEDSQLIKQGNQRRRLVIAGAMVLGPMIVAGSAQSARADHSGTHSSTGSTP